MQVLHHPESGLVPPSGTAVTIGAYDGVHRGHRAVIARVRELAASRGLQSAAGHLRPPSGQRGASRVGAQAAVRPPPAARAAGRDRARLHVGDPLRRGAGQGGARGLRARGAGRRAWARGPWWWGPTSTSATVAWATWPCSSAWARRTTSRSWGWTWSGWTAGRRRATPRSPPPPSAWRWPPATCPPPPRCWAGPTRSAARWSAATGGPESSGFRTANVAVPDEICLPADGIYAGWYLRPDGVARPAALSLGRRPTFYEHADTSLLEAHLLDFDDDLYGERGPGAVRVSAASRGEVRLGRGPGGPDGPRLRGGWRRAAASWNRGTGSPSDLVPGSVRRRSTLHPPPTRPMKPP